MLLTVLCANQNPQNNHLETTLFTYKSDTAKNGKL